MIIKSVLNIPLFIGCIGAIYSFLLFYILNKITSALKLRECPKCKEIIVSTDDFTYKVLKEWVSKEVSTNNNRTHVKQDEMALVEINSVCQKCGTPKQFTREFNVAHYLDGELRFSYELDSLVKDFMAGKKFDNSLD